MTNPVSDLVSIIIPVKNGDKFLIECVDSILSQTYEKWELILINDHSSDGTKEIIDAYEIKDCRVKTSINKGVGIIKALQTGFQLAKGNFITRMDADDIMSKDKIELLLTKLIEKGGGHVATGLVEYFSENTLGEGYYNYQQWLNSLTIKSNNFQEIFRECVIPSPCWMVHREDFEKCGGFNSEMYPEDYDLCFRFYKHNLKVASVSSVIHFWRDYPTRTSRTDENYADNFFLELKMIYFLELHHDKSRPLEIWGAGKKGKELARYLLNKHIEFDWACNNPNKIGKEIYGKKLKSDEYIFSQKHPQILVVIRNEDASKQITQLFESKGLTPLVDYFFMA